MLFHKSRFITIVFLISLFSNIFIFSESLELKNLKQFNLSNKMKVLLIQEKGNPLVKLRIVFFNGESSSTPGLEGLASLTASSFFKGSYLFPEAQLSRLLSYYGVNLSSEVREEKTSFSISIPKKNFDKFLKIVRDLLLRNTFPENSLNKERNLMIRDMKKRNEDPFYLVYSFFYKNLLQKTPYPRIFFTENSLKNITSQNCLTFSKKYYIPNNSFFLIWGDFETDEIKALIEREFRGWTEKRLFYPYVPSSSPVKENIVSILNLPLEDSYFIIGNVLPALNLEDRAGLLLINEIIGGSDFSRLSFKYKETPGYCNSIESGVVFFKNNTLFFVIGQCKNEKIKEVLLGVSAEIKDLKEKKIEERELKSAKEYLIGDIIVRNSDPEVLLSSLEDAILFEYPLDYMNRILRSIEESSSQNILSIMNKYFKIESNFIVVAGKKEFLVDFLKDFGKLEIYFKINNSWEREK